MRSGRPPSARPGPASSRTVNRRDVNNHRSLHSQHLLNCLESESPGGKRSPNGKDTHRGLWYEDGVMKRILDAGRYRIPRHWDIWFYRTPRVEIVLVDMRERDLTIKGQEILTADKVAIWVNLLVQ